TNIGRMGQLIDDLLAFSRLGRQQMKIRAVDMTLLAKTVVDELLASEPGRRIEISMSKIPPAMGDQVLVREVLTNLIANAIKFTRKKETARIEIGFDPEARGGAYYVKDNGVGFDMRYVGKLFGVFQRLHSTNEFEGTGVGLALVQRIVVRHGGVAWAVGELDQGATFYFTLGRPEDEK
ncbi:MAG: ATP-binding protein, partial [Methanomassiliicoccales archaeon]